MPDLLIEIGCEELPAAACREAERQLPELLTRSLSEAGLASRDARIHVGPRRLVAIASVPPQRDAVATRQRGPRADAPEAARAGFARKHGLAVDELEQREGFVWAVSDGRAAPAVELVPDAVHRIVAGLQFAKTMRWPGGRFSRPIRWLVVKLDDEVVEMELAGVASGGESRGHRSLGAVRVGSAASYLDDLRGVHVLADAAERRELIVEGLEHGRGVDRPDGQAGRGRPPGRVAAWCSRAGSTSATWSCPSASRSPRCSRTSATSRSSATGRARRPLRVRRERRRRGGGRGRERGGAGGAAGGCRLRARQATWPAASPRCWPSCPASASWRGRGRWPTRRSGCARYRGSCATGSRSSRRCARRWRGRRRCARPTWCRASWPSSPTCRGTPGRCTRAMRASRPTCATRSRSTTSRSRRAGRCPRTRAAALLSVSDKADTVAVAFALGAQPTGSRDPYGLRRAAAGIVAIALERGYELGLVDLMAESVHMLVSQGHELRRKPLEAVPDAVDFVLDRVEPLMAEEGVTVDEMRAARGSGVTGPLPLAALCRALRDAPRSRLAVGRPRRLRTLHPDHGQGRRADGLRGADVAVRDGRGTGAVRGADGGRHRDRPMPPRGATTHRRWTLPR